LAYRVGKAEFRESMDLGIKYARALRCRNLHCLVGIAPEEFPEEIVRRTLVENLHFAAEVTKR
jgi:hydroxypyruvate isomerase